MMAAFRMLMLTSVYSLAAKHTYISRTKNWFEAQANCRANFIDLSGVTTEAESEAFKKEQGARLGWIGLYRDTTSPTDFSWSGGGPVNYTEWSPNEPPNIYNYGVWHYSGWFLRAGLSHFSSFCFNLIVNAEKKSWEEALEYCRENHTELTSLTSEHEVLLAQREIQQDNITDQVWIGLRFLGSSWSWVNKDPLEYQAWTKGGDSQCPEKTRCGAFTKGGQWEKWDCQDRLSFICY